MPGAYVIDNGVEFVALLWLWRARQTCCLEHCGVPYPLWRQALRN